MMFMCFIQAIRKNKNTVNIMTDKYFINLKNKIKSFLKKEHKKYLREKLIYTDYIFLKLEKNIFNKVRNPEVVTLNVKELENKMGVKNKNLSFFKEITDTLFNLSLNVDYPNGDYIYIRIMQSRKIGNDTIHIVFADDVIEKKNASGKIKEVR